MKHTARLFSTDIRKKGSPLYMSKFRFALVALATLTLLTACSGGEPAEGDVLLVAGQRFEPSSLTVTSGDTVTFSVDSPDPHTVTAYEEDLPDGTSFFSTGGASSEEEARSDVASALITEGDTFEVVLEEPGTYRYFCIPHEAQGMKGSITVTG